MGRRNRVMQYVLKVNLNSTQRLENGPTARIRTTGRSTCQRNHVPQSQLVMLVATAATAAAAETINAATASRSPLFPTRGNDKPSDETTIPHTQSYITGLTPAKTGCMHT